MEGLINKFITENSKEWLKTFCVYIMPMANKDGVALGMTRFNVRGKDLNRNWDREPDSILCPEKYVLEKFLKGLINKGIKPCFGIDIHNDDAGGIILAQHSKDDTQFVKNMQLFEAIVYELNANRISSLNKMPTAKDWMAIGENLNKVFYEYLSGLN